MHARMDGIERQHVEEAAPQPGLVGCHGQAPSRVGEARHGLGHARHGHPFLWHGDEFLAGRIERAVAVENGEFHARDYGRCGAPGTVPPVGGASQPVA